MGSRVCRTLVFILLAAGISLGTRKNQKQPKPHDLAPPQMMTCSTDTLLCTVAHLGDISCPAWEDSFPGPQVDTARWTVQNRQAPGYIAYKHIGYYESYNANIVAPGVLRLDLVQENGTVNGSPGIVSYGAAITTNFPCGYGTYEWTMKMSSDGLCADTACVGSAYSGSVSAGFLYVNNSQTEIDFEFEAQNPFHVYLVNWLNTNPKSAPTGSMETWSWYPPDGTQFNPVDGLHVYQFVWAPGSIVYYIDGNQVATHTTNVPSAPAYFWINHWGTDSTDWGGIATVGVTRHFYITHVSYRPSTTLLTATTAGESKK